MENEIAENSTEEDSYETTTSHLEYELPIKMDSSNQGFGQKKFLSKMWLL